MSYDEKCEELAKHFLPSDASQKTIQQLAQRVQDFVEDELSDMIIEARVGCGVN